MSLKHTLAALCLAAGLLHSAAAQTVLRYSDHEPYGNMRTRFINNVFFKHVECKVALLFALFCVNSCTIH